MGTVNLGKVVGPAGPAGPQGATGATGPQGTAGADAVVDATLTQAGQAADAAVVGAVLVAASGNDANLPTRLDRIDGTIDGQIIYASSEDNPASIYASAGGRISATVQTVADQAGSGTPSIEIPREFAGKASVDIDVGEDTYTLTPAATLYGVTGAEDEIGNDGHEIHKTYFLTLSGDQSWLKPSSSYDLGLYFRFYYAPSPVLKASAKGISNMFPWTSNIVLTSDTFEQVGKVSTSGNLQVIILKSRMTGWSDAWSDSQKITAFKAFLNALVSAGTPIKVLYEGLTETTHTNTEVPIFAPEYTDPATPESVDVSTTGGTLSISYSASITKKLEDNVADAASDTADALIAGKAYAVKTCPRFAKYANGGARTMTAEGRYVYTTKGAVVQKIDMGIESSPETSYSVTLTVSGYTLSLTGIAISGDYLMVGGRSYVGGAPTAGVEQGRLWVLNKGDLTTVTSIPYIGRKISDVIVYGSLMIVVMQMVSWAIYDITDPTSPSLLYEWVFVDHTPSSDEHQRGEIFEEDGHMYFAAAGFGDGVALYNIDTPSAPTRLMLWRFYGDTSPAIGGYVHTFDLFVDYPYLYCSLAPSSAHASDSDRIMGILRLDITNPASPTYEIFEIPAADTGNYIDGGDPKPTIIAQVEDRILLNNSEKGVSVFEIQDGDPVYITTKDMGGNVIYPILPMSDGRVFVGDSYDANSGSLYLHLLRGI